MSHLNVRTDNGDKSVIWNNNINYKYRQYTRLHCKVSILKDYYMDCPVYSNYFFPIRYKVNKCSHHWLLRSSSVSSVPHPHVFV